jgi:hypothetical protein
MKPNIYLDVDGVLLANDLNLANHAEEFIAHVVNNYPTYWLTTHCMNGDPTQVIRNVGRLCSPETQQLLTKIQPTTWRTAKTEAIDFTKPFLWFDDDCYGYEQQVLKQHGAFDNWIEVNLRQDPNQLAKFLTSFPLPQNKNS